MRMRPIPMNSEMVRAILDGRKTQTRRPVKQTFDHGQHADAVFKDGSGLGWVAWFGPGPHTAEKTARLYPGPEGFPCPYGQPGDRLWVREPGRVDYVRDGGEDGMALAIRYMADDVVRLVEVPERLDIEWQRKYKEGWPVPKWVSGCQGIPNGVFREAARITLDFSVRVERLQDITEADAIAEGIELPENGAFRNYGTAPEDNEGYDWCKTAAESYRTLWDSIYYPGIYKKPSSYKWDANPWVWVFEFRRLAE